jgi:hypothetical protein
VLGPERKTNKHTDLKELAVQWKETNTKQVNNKRTWLVIRAERKAQWDKTGSDQALTLLGGHIGKAPWRR